GGDHRDQPGDGRSLLLAPALPDRFGSGGEVGGRDQKLDGIRQAKAPDDRDTGESCERRARKCAGGAFGKRGGDGVSAQLGADSQQRGEEAGGGGHRGTAAARQTGGGTAEGPEPPAHPRA